MIPSSLLVARWRRISLAWPGLWLLLLGRRLDEALLLRRELCVWRGIDRAISSLRLRGWPISVLRARGLDVVVRDIAALWILLDASIGFVGVGDNDVPGV